MESTSNSSARSTQKSLATWAKDAWGILRAAFPHKEVPEDTARYYRSELIYLAEEIGPERAELAIRATLRDPEHQYFPNVAEIRAHIPPKPTVPESRLTYAEPGCKKCAGTGWEMIETIGEKDKRARRCACWKANVLAGIKRAVPLMTAAEVEAARKSPEAQAFRKKLREIVAGKSMDKQRPQTYVPSAEETRAILRQRSANA